MGNSEKESDLLPRIIVTTAAIATIFEISKLAAPWAIRIDIFKRDKFKCRDGETPVDEDTGVAGHNNHRRQKGIHRRGNIKLRCRPREITWHANHFDNPDSIGLTRDQNIDAILLQWERLSEEDQINFKKNRHSIFARFHHLL